MPRDIGDSLGLDNALEELTKEAAELKAELEQLGVLFPYEVYFFDRHLQSIERRYKAYILTAIHDELK